MGETGADSVRRFLKDRAILLGLPMDDVLSRAVKEAISELEAAGPAPITLYVNSPGGIARCGEEIIEAMQRTRLEVSTCCLGLAAGAAAHILLAGVRRFAVSGAVVVFNDFCGNDYNDSTDIERVRNRAIGRAGSILETPAGIIDEWLRTERRFSGAALLEHRIIHQFC